MTLTSGVEVADDIIRDLLASWDMCVDSALLVASLGSRTSGAAFARGRANYEHGNLYETVMRRQGTPTKNCELDLPQRRIHPRCQHDYPSEGGRAP